MATGTDVDDTLAAEISDSLLTCHVCTDQMTSPKILPCFHTFCQVCLEAWVEKNQGNLTCPTCRKEVPLPAEGVKRLRPNLTVEGLLEIFSKRDDVTTCKACRRPAVVWCVDCSQFFCQECRVAHETVRFLRTHKLTTIEEYRNINARRQCKVHPKLLELFCDRCQATLCKECAEDNHGGHEIMSLEAAVTKHRPLLETCASHVGECLTALDREKKILEKTLNGLKKQEHEIADKVRKAAADAINKIKEEEKRLLQDVARISRERQSQTQNKLKAIVVNVGHMKNVQTFAAALLQNRNQCDILNGKKILEDDFEHGKRAIASRQRIVAPQSALKFVVNDAFWRTTIGSVVSSCEKKSRVSAHLADDTRDKAGEKSQTTRRESMHRSDDNKPINICPICQCEIQRQKTLPCGHTFCMNCIDLELQINGKNCPVCKQGIEVAVSFGKMPKGTIDHRIDKSLRIPGYPQNTGCIIIDYHFRGGIQGEGDPSPGNKYNGATYIAYLPATEEGMEIRKLLHIAFKRELTFTIGTSPSGAPDCIIWNGIEHKTATTGGPERHGYPDPGYFGRVKKQLAARGVR